MAKNNTPKKMGRPPHTHLPYHLARQYVRENGIKTRAQYWKWFKEENVKGLPYRPEEKYAEWINWGDFLGTDNSFEKTLARNKGVYAGYVDYWEAVHRVKPLVDKYGIDSEVAWYEYCDEYGVPEGIPKYPKQKYGEIFSWITFLSKSVNAKVEAAVNVQKIVGLMLVEGEPPNVIKVVKWEARSDIEGQFYKLYAYEDGVLTFIDRVLRENGTAQPDGTFIMHNLNNALWQLMDLKIVQ